MADGGEGGEGPGGAGEPARAPKVQGVPAPRPEWEVIMSVRSYRWVRLLGRGQYGTAHLVHSESGEEAVAKVVFLDHLKERDRALALQENDVLQRLQHPNVVRHYESWIYDPSVGGAPGTEALVTVMEYCAGGDLNAWLKECSAGGQKLTEERVLHLFAQILLGVRYIHHQHILHRDLKTSNMLMDADHTTVKIGDFGIARVLENTVAVAVTMLGTPYYMSPEVCKGEPYDRKSDMWSLGCVLYEMCTFEHAFKSPSLLGLVYCIVSEQYEPIPLGRYSSALAELVARLLAKSALERPDADEALATELLRHYVGDGGDGASLKGALKLGVPLAPGSVPPPPPEAPFEGAPVPPPTPPREDSPSPSQLLGCVGGPPPPPPAPALDAGGVAPPQEPPPMRRPSDSVAMSSSGQPVARYWFVGRHTRSLSPDRPALEETANRGTAYDEWAQAFVAAAARAAGSPSPSPAASSRARVASPTHMAATAWRTASPTAAASAWRTASPSGLPPASGHSLDPRAAMARSGSLRARLGPAAPSPAPWPEADYNSQVLLARTASALLRRPRQLGSWVQAFARHDAIGQGWMGREEFAAFLDSLSLGLSQAEARQLAERLAGGSDAVTLGGFSEAITRSVPIDVRRAEARAASEAQARIGAVGVQRLEMEVLGSDPDLRAWLPKHPDGAIDWARAEEWIAATLYAPRR